MIKFLRTGYNLSCKVFGILYNLLIFFIVVLDQTETDKQ